MATQFRENFLETTPFSDTGAKLWLAANTELTWTVPGSGEDKYRAKFSYTEDSNVWIKLNGAVIAPVAGTAVNTYNEEFKPDQRYVVGGDVLHFVSTGTPQVGVSLLSLPG